MSKVELRHLRTVIVVADCGSFTSAALHLNTEISAVSRAVRDLEEQLGVLIFERLPRGVQLTAAGVSYVASAREILERYARADVDARLAGTKRELHLAIGFPWSAASTPLVELLRAFATGSPATAVEVVEAGNDELIDRLRSRRLDLAIAITDPPPLPRLKGIGPLSSHLLWLEQLAVAAPASLDIDKVTWGDLAPKRLLCRAIDDWPRFIRHVERLGGPTLAFEPHAISQEGLTGLVAAGLGWTIVPASLGHLLPADVRVIPIASAGAVLQVEAVWRAENGNPALRVFLALCRQLYRQTKEESGAPS